MDRAEGLRRPGGVGRGLGSAAEGWAPQGVHVEGARHRQISGLAVGALWKRRTELSGLSGGWDSLPGRPRQPASTAKDPAGRVERKVERGRLGAGVADARATVLTCHMPSPDEALQEDATRPSGQPSHEPVAQTHGWNSFHGVGRMDHATPHAATWHPARIRGLLPGLPRKGRIRGPAPLSI
jgi:hypothetical protein